MHDLTIIIVTWNSRDCITGCLRSIEEKRPGCDYVVVVVDNNSGDGTPALIKEKFPWVTLVANNQNIGFAAANNQAMHLSQSRTTMLLNPDTVVVDGVFDALVRFLDSDERVWAAGPTVLNPDRTFQFSGVRFPTLMNILVETMFLDRLFSRSRAFGSHRALFADPEKPRRVEYLQGSALIVRNKAIEMVGGLDERFFMYFEETDWCYRIRENGGEVWYAPVGSIIHHGGGEFGHFDERRLLHYYASLLLFFRKHYGMFRRIVLRPLLALRCIIRLLVWGSMILVRPEVREEARSSARGYLRVLLLLAGEQ